MDILIKVIQFFLCFTILVGIHELGHFIMARVFRIRVDKFYIFFNPWFSIFKFRRGNTEYGLGWLPLGGYCKIAGMVDESMDKAQLRQEPKPWEFRSHPAWQRLIVMLAGVFMNLLLAIVIYCGIAYTWGDAYFSNHDAHWGYNFNETAHAMGFRDGDRFISIDGEEIDDVHRLRKELLLTEHGREVEVERGGERVTVILSLDELVAMRQNKAYEDFFVLRMPFVVDTVEFPAAVAAGLRAGDEIVRADTLAGAEYPEYREYIASRSGSPVEVDVLRGGEVLPLVLPVDAEGRIGVQWKSPYVQRVRYYTFWESIPAGLRAAGGTVADYWLQLKLILNPKTKMHEELGGFITIASIFPSSWNWPGFWLTTALLSIILAVMNLLPIPGLDGGHALFTLWEIITRRKPSDRFLETATYIGLILVLGLIVYANGNDIFRFFIK